MSEAATAAAPRRLAANLVFSALGNALGLAQQLVTVPLYLWAWGDRLYGDWLTISAMVAYLTLADMGMQMYVVNRLTTEALQDRWEEFASTLHSALAVYAVAAAGAAAVIAGLALGLPWGEWFAGHALPGAHAAVIVVLLGAGVLGSIGSGFFTALYRAFVEPERSSLLGTAFRAGQLAATCALLWAGASPVALAAAQAALPALFGLWVARDLRARHPRAAPSLHRAESKVALSLVVPSALFLLITLANGLTVQGTVLVASGALGASAVTAFATSRTLVSVVRQTVSLLNGVLWPELTRLAARGATERMAFAHRLLVKVSSTICLFFVASLWFVGPALHAWWTGGRAQFDGRLFQWLLLYALLQTPWLASSVLLAATNRHRGLAFAYILQGVLAVAGAYAATRALGLEGIGLALLTTDFAVFGVWVPLRAQALAEEPGWRYFAEVYPPLAVFAAAAFAAGFAADAAVPVASPRLLAVPAAVGAVAAVSLWLWLRAGEREALLASLRRLLASREAPP